MKFPVIFISGIIAPTRSLGWSYFNGVCHLAAGQNIEAHFANLYTKIGSPLDGESIHFFLGDEDKHVMAAFAQHFAHGQRRK